MRSYARLCVIGNYHQGGSRQRECPVAVDLKQRDGFMENSYSNEYCYARCFNSKANDNSHNRQFVVYWKHRARIAQFVGALRLKSIAFQHFCVIN